jgi:hypothetical protein
MQVLIYAAAIGSAQSPSFRVFKAAASASREAASKSRCLVLGRATAVLVSVCLSVRVLYAVVPVSG